MIGTLNLLCNCNHVVSPPGSRVDPEQELVERTNDDVLCVIAAKKIQKLLLSPEGSLQQLEREEGATGEGVGKRLRSIGEITTGLV